MRRQGRVPFVGTGEVTNCHWLLESMGNLVPFVITTFRQKVLPPDVQLLLPSCRTRTVFSTTPTCSRRRQSLPPRKSLLAHQRKIFNDILSHTDILYRCMHLLQDSAGSPANKLQALLTPCPVQIVSITTCTHIRSIKSLISSKTRIF